MSAGIEKLKTSIRIWWKINGKRERETLYNTPPTPENCEKAQQIANMIATQIKMGIFEREKIFPNSTKHKNMYFAYYINIWQTNQETTVSPSTWKTYQSKVTNHIQPYWSQKIVAKITVEDVEFWVYRVLQKKLTSKTIKDILMLFHAIWTYWARHQSNPNNPIKYIKLNHKDKEDIDPFTRQEIEIIINTETDHTLKNLWTVMLWSGLSIHELLPLAIEDLDLENHCLFVRRGFVKGLYRATKNRRRKRQVELLPIVTEALSKQKAINKNNKKSQIYLLERDHVSKTSQNLIWVWSNSHTSNHYTYVQLEKRWKRHLKKCQIRYRPLNNGRHTYASQVLSTGAVTAEWLANQLGHSSTEMIHKHYGKFIPADASHIINKLHQAINN